jgi:glucans biosynthesis protein C
VPKKREHHLDALRASAILLLIPYHANKFLYSRGEQVDFGHRFAYYVHTFHMPLFFALSGYLAAGAVARRGVLGSSGERLKKLGIPLVVGMLVMIPLCNIVLNSYAPRHHGMVAPGATMTLNNIFTTGPLILWFLMYLLIMTLVCIAIWGLLRNTVIGRAGVGLFRAVMSSPLVAIPVLALISTALLTLGTDWEASRAVGGTLAVDWSLLGYYAIYFVFGWMLAANRDLVPNVERAPIINLVLGAGCAWLGFRLFGEQKTFIGDDWARPLTLFLGGGLACWLTLFGLWGAFARWFPGEKPAVRYVADASFWIYLFHLPALLLIENALAGTSLPPGIRWVLASLSAIAVALATYAIFIRHTPIGTFLHGPRKRSPDTRGGPEAPAPATG